MCDGLLRCFPGRVFPLIIMGALCTTPLRAQFKVPKEEPVAVYVNDSSGLLQNHDLTIMYLPLARLRITNINETRKVVKREFPDSFFIESTHELIMYECSKHFPVNRDIERFTVLEDSSFIYTGPRYSVLKNDTACYDSISQYLQKVASACNVDLLLYPYRCDLKNIVFKQEAWRRETNNTARPIQYRARTAIHVQIWDRTGKLLYEKIGRNQTKRPILYSIFKKRRMKDDESIEEFSQKYFAPPLLRSLSESIAMALDFDDKK